MIHSHDKSEKPYEVRRKSYTFNMTTRKLEERSLCSWDHWKYYDNLETAEQALFDYRHNWYSTPWESDTIVQGQRRWIKRIARYKLVKRGEDGVSIYKKNGSRTNVTGFPVEVLNVLGAGDAFAGGFLYGYLQGWDLYKACRMGNASGAQVVTKKGCANFMPTLEESLAFIEKHGGY